MAKTGEKKKDDSRQHADPEAEARKKLKSLAVSRGLLGRSPASHSAALRPSSAVLKLDGRDIVKRGGQRRNRYLFSFPGLLAPLSAGRIGDLADLGTRNPVLYLEFPQGRMKLFGTHVYPKNKYLTLQTSRSAKGVMCEDCFESMIVFSDSWWIGAKDENPEEHRLEFPTSLLPDKNLECDFKGGAGSSLKRNFGGDRPGKECKEPYSLGTDVDDVDAFVSDESFSGDEKSNQKIMEATPVRQSARISGKSLNYAEPSSGDDTVAYEAEIKDKGNVSALASSRRVASKLEFSDAKIVAPEAYDKSDLPSNTSKGKEKKKGILVQSTLSALFERAPEKKTKRKESDSPILKGSSSKRLKLSSEKNPSDGLIGQSNKKGVKPCREKTGTKSQLLQKQIQVGDDDIEEISSSSEDLEDSSDGDWAA